MKSLDGKVAVITGGSSGIGLATAKIFQEAGAKVAVTGRTQKTLDDAAKELGNGALVLRSDVSKLADLDRLYSAVTKQFGRIDVLFANAGIAKFAPATDTSEAIYDEIFDINVKGLFFSIQKALPFLNGGASIILNSSVVGQSGIANATAYSASKAAVRSFARTLTTELAPRNIRVNVISPGPITTPIFDKLGLPKEAVEEFAAKVLPQVPLKRFGKPEEVGQAALFFASNASSYITGVELNVDGGMGQV
jgi:NAD(P)-dependent dehydrogenase (short-subunit alcohol dehydrogenase family)